MNRPYIRAWGEFMLSQDYYIEEQVRLAGIDGAPEDAIYRKGDGVTWIRLSEVRNMAAVDWMRRALKSRFDVDDEIPQRGPSPFRGTVRMR